MGLVAKRQSVTNPDNTLYATKRLIGRRMKVRSLVRSSMPVYRGMVRYLLSHRGALALFFVSPNDQSSSNNPLLEWRDVQMELFR